MKTMTYSESRANYAATLDAVLDDREEVVITRAGKDPVVIVSLDDYQSLKETAYLLRSPENARRLLGAIENRKILKRINILIRDVQRNGNEGIGKPEPLKHGFQGYWSRRINDEHRLVYKVVEQEVRIAQCRYHYSR